MLIKLMKDGETGLNLIKITPDLDRTNIKSMVVANAESQELENFLNGKLNMITFYGMDNTLTRTSFILRRF